MYREHLRSIISVYILDLLNFKLRKKIKGKKERKEKGQGNPISIITDDVTCLGSFSF